MIYQLVSVDFDVWSYLRTDVGGARAQRLALLGVRDPNSGLGVYIGLRGLSASSEIHRLDEYAAATLAETNVASIATLTYAWVRLKRAGGRFRAFYATAAQPAVAADWTEAPQIVAQSFASSADVRVGLAGYTNNTAVGEARWKFLR